MKRTIAVFAALALPLFMAAAGAHTALRTATPANGSTVAEAPKEIVLEFSGAVRLTTVSVASAAGKKVETGAIPTATAQKFAVPVSGALTAGDYVVTWRAVGGDTHVVSGEVKFTLGAPAAAGTLGGTAGAERTSASQDAAAATSGVNAPR